MRAWWRCQLAKLERRVINRRDSTSALVLVECTQPFLILLWALQLYAARDPQLALLYRQGWLWPSLWAQGALIAWLSVMGAVAWRLRDDKRPLNWLVQLTVLPAGWGTLLLSLAFGLKDTPMCMMLLAQFVFVRSLFPARQLKWLMGGALLIVLACEVAVQSDWLPYAPMLAAPIYHGEWSSWWWVLWTRALYMCAALPLSGWFFFLGATLRRHRHVLENVARTDMLTGLANRREFMSKLEQEALRQARSMRPLSIVMFDIDHFKHVNDSHGHPAGDEVLARLGHILRTSTRAHIDTAARYGGEEFVLLLPETDLQGARTVAEKISAKLRGQKFRANGQTFSVTQSVGIAQLVEGDAMHALKVADDNLYRAKQAGRNCIVGSVVAREPTPPPNGEAVGCDTGLTCNCSVQPCHQAGPAHS